MKRAKTPAREFLDDTYERWLMDPPSITHALEKDEGSEDSVRRLYSDFCVLWGMANAALPTPQEQEEA